MIDEYLTFLNEEDLEEKLGLLKKFSKLLKDPSGRKAAREARKKATHQNLDAKRLKNAAKRKEEVAKRIKDNKLKRKLRSGQPINVTPRPKRITGAQRQIEYKPR